MLKGPGGHGITINPPPATTALSGRMPTQPRYVPSEIAVPSHAAAAAMASKSAGIPMSRNIRSRCSNDAWMSPIVAARRL